MFKSFRGSAVRCTFALVSSAALISCSTPGPVVLNANYLAERLAQGR